MEIDTEDLTKCPHCGGDCFKTIVDELQRHNLKIGESYRLIHCDKCCAYYKEVWKFDRLILLKEINSKPQSLKKSQGNKKGKGWVDVLLDDSNKQGR